MTNFKEQLNYTYKRPYTREYQREKNEELVKNINEYWAKFGLKANARVELKKVYVSKAGGPKQGYGQEMLSHEIVSCVAEFPSNRNESWI